MVIETNAQNERIGTDWLVGGRRFTAQDLERGALKIIKRDGNILYILFLF